MFDFEALKHAAGPVTPELVKEHLPILYVMEANGHYPAKDEAGRFKFFSPFRQDSDPSFDVFQTDKGVRWGDFAEGSQGDVIDLVGRFFELTMGRKPNYRERMDECRKYVEQLKESGWSGPELRQRKSFDLEAAKELYLRATTEPNVGLIELFLSQRDDCLQELSADWLCAQFEVGAVTDRLVIPYLNRDGELVAYKHRIVGGPTMSAPGSGLYDDVLYGEWRDTDPSKPVVLCEGETDTWWAAYVLGDDYAVLGLPTGAGAHAKQAARLENRTVYLAFDGDKSGRIATYRWSAALQGTVLLVPVPEKLDLARCRNLHEMLARAQVPVLPPEDALEETEARGYYRKPQSEKVPAKQVSNWCFHPERVLTNEDGGCVYEGRVSTRPHTEVAISNQDMLNSTALRRWAALQGGFWSGADSDAQVLQGMLQAKASFLPTGRMTRVAGLHDGQFVWPGGQLGHDRWAYLPPVNDAKIAGQLTLTPGPVAPATFALLRSMHSHAVVDPMLCWLAMAPLRPLMPGRAFPVLTVAGGSGTGKTTLTETITRVFSGSSIQLNLTSTTPHAVDSYISATNAFPVHFDEYRPGARKEAIERLNQLLRDVYTAQPSARGGMNRANVSEVTQLVPSAPIIVTGEDSFHETSHTERMVLIPLPKDGRSPQALAAVQSLPVGPFAHAYLSWLQARYIEDGSTTLTIEPWGPEHLPSRSRYNLGVLRFGWQLLQQFVADHGGVLDGEPELGLVVTEATEAASSNPIRDAILWALEETDPDTGVVEADHGVIGVRPETFVAYITRKGTFTLPGGAKAVRKFLIATYAATEGQVTHTGRIRTCLLVDRADLLG